MTEAPLTHIMASTTHPPTAPLVAAALIQLPVRREKFQLMGVTCFLLAAKVEEVGDNCPPFLFMWVTLEGSRGLPTPHTLWEHLWTPPYLPHTLPTIPTHHFAMAPVPTRPIHQRWKKWWNGAKTRTRGERCVMDPSRLKVSASLRGQRVREGLYDERPVGEIEGRYNLHTRVRTSVCQYPPNSPSDLAPLMFRSLLGAFTHGRSFRTN